MSPGILTDSVQTMGSAPACGARSLVFPGVEHKDIPAGTWTFLPLEDLDRHAKPRRDDGRLEAVVSLIPFVLHGQSRSLRQPPPLPLRRDHDEPGVIVRVERLEPEIRR